MKTAYLAVVLLAATGLSPAVAGHTSRSSSRYAFTMVLPRAAKYVHMAGSSDNAINSAGVVALDAWFEGGGSCGGAFRAFAYLPKSRKYVVLGAPPKNDAVATDAYGVANDGSVAVAVFGPGPVKYPCRLTQTAVYRVTHTGTSPHWSAPCTCSGLTPVGINLDGIALDEFSGGAEVLTFPGGTPTVSPMATSVGSSAGASITAVGTPRGFVGTQTRDASYGPLVPTVWLSGKPYVLPVAHTRLGLPTPLGMEERRGTGGLRIDVVGTFFAGSTAKGVDFWQGKPKGTGYVFREERHFIQSPDMVEAQGISTNGSMIFGQDKYQDDDLVVYFTGSRREKNYWGACTNHGPAWGDSRGDVLVFGPDVNRSGDASCLARPRR